MKTTVVPAQVTTVEDKIAGNLGVSQLMLLTVPVFGGSALFVILPPFFNYATYKVVLVVCLAAIAGTLAIRIRGKILLHWMIVMLRYNNRPRYYVLNKNQAHLRDMDSKQELKKVTKEAKPKRTVRQKLPQLSTADLVHVQDIITDPNANLYFKTDRKGKLSVYITEVK